MDLRVPPEATEVLGLFVRLGYGVWRARASAAALCAAALVLLQGCALAPPAVVALANTVGSALTGASSALPGPERLSANLSYLYVQAPGQAPVFFALGYIEPGALASDPPTLVWFSAQREVLRTQGGRLLGLTGVPQGKTALSWSPSAPAWVDFLAQKPSAPATSPSFVRTWDEPARHRFGRTDRVSIHLQRPSDLPRTVLRHLRGPLLGADYSNWSWLVQRSDREPQAWFALAPVAGAMQVVYSYQCLDADTCFHIAPWPLGQVALP